MPQPRETKDIVTDLESLAESLSEGGLKNILIEAIDRINALEKVRDWHVEQNGRLNKEILRLAGELENPATQSDPDAVARRRTR